MKLCSALTPRTRRGFLELPQLERDNGVIPEAVAHDELDAA